jgi:hypothetical protein
MKWLLTYILLVTCSAATYAQFPLGSDVKKITAYFDANIPYTSAQEFKTADGIAAICITKAKVLGDYVFYFDKSGKCFTYTVTYGKDEMVDLIARFNIKFSRLIPNKWAARDTSFDVTLVPAKPGENYFSIVYKPISKTTLPDNSLASN